MQLIQRVTSDGGSICIRSQLWQVHAQAGVDKVGMNFDEALKERLPQEQHLNLRILSTNLATPNCSYLLSTPCEHLQYDQLIRS